MYKINLNPNEKLIDVSESLYGLFFEDINRAGDGGLYAELLRNRAFDEGIIPAECEYESKNKLIISNTGWKSSFDCYELEGIASWEAVHGAKMRLTDKNFLHKNRKRALEVNFHGGSICNDGFMGIPVESGKSYRFFMFAKSEEKTEISISLKSEKGIEYAKSTFEVFGDFEKYMCELTSMETDYNARLVITSDASNIVTFGFTSLFPKETYMGRENGLRKSLVDRLLKLKPAFLRFPGGCIVEGFSKETAFRFADTIGPIWERKPHWLLWAYMTTNGLGFHEYLQFCEDAKIDAMYVFNCGMTCQGRNPDYFDDNLIEEFYVDTVHAILYATASPETEWGALRAENGHPEPFEVLKYIEIGNENWGDEYKKRYGLFYDRLKKEFPQFTYIATDHTEKSGMKTEMVDEHFYSDPVFFATNTKLYDNLDRNGVKIYCGEYAATIGCKKGNLYAALGEAAFLTGIERNQDMVTMTSYAPIFQNVAYKAWEPDMIIFNNHEDYVIPSYYMLEMFGNNRGNYVCQHRVETNYDKHIEKGNFSIVLENGISFTKIKLNENPCKEIRTLEGNLEIEHNENTMLTGVGIGIIGDTPQSSQYFSAVVYCENSKITVRFWDVGLSGEDQNHYDWVMNDGISSVVHYNGWSRETICEPMQYHILEEKNTVEIYTYGDSFKIILNGVTLHDKILTVIPHITAVCTVDEKMSEVITKLVNFSEIEIMVNIKTESDIMDEARITTLTADRYDSINTFDDKTAVFPYTQKIKASSDYDVVVKPRSVNVIRQKIRV